MRLSVVIAAVLAVSGCAATSVTPVAQNRILISTSAAPACGRTGASKVAAKMAAVETIRRGYERFIILGMGGSSDVSVIPGRVTGAHTSANASIYGNNAYGMATTTYTSTPPMIIGGHDSSLDVLMLKKGDRNFGDGIDAKRELGDNWASIVKNGIQACT